MNERQSERDPFHAQELFLGRTAVVWHFAATAGRMEADMRKATNDGAIDTTADGLQASDGVAV